MSCSEIMSLILLGGTVLGISAGTLTEVVLAKRGYQPTNYLALWQAKWAARSSHTLPANSAA
jgi:hypothetical protein